MQPKRTVREKISSFPVKFCHSNEVFSAQFGPDGQKIVSAGGGDKTVRVWSATAKTSL